MAATKKRASSTKPRRPKASPPAPAPPAPESPDLLFLIDFVADDGKPYYTYAAAANAREAVARMGSPGGRRVTRILSVKRAERPRMGSGMMETEQYERYWRNVAEIARGKERGGRDRDRDPGAGCRCGSARTAPARRDPGRRRTLREVVDELMVETVAALDLRRALPVAVRPDDPAVIRARDQLAKVARKWRALAVNLEAIGEHVGAEDSASRADTLAREAALLSGYFVRAAPNGRRTRGAS